MSKKVHPAPKHYYHIIDIYFRSRGVSLNLKEPIHREVFNRNLYNAKTIYEMAGKDEEAAIKKVHEVWKWAEGRALDWNLSTVIKRWLERNEAAPKKPFCIIDGKKFPAKIMHNIWYVEDGEGWKEVNTQYVNTNKAIVWE